EVTLRGAAEPLGCWLPAGQVRCEQHDRRTREQHSVWGWGPVVPRPACVESNREESNHEAIWYWAVLGRFAVRNGCHHCRVKLGNGCRMATVVARPAAYRVYQCHRTEPEQNSRQYCVRSVGSRRDGRERRRTFGALSDASRRW